MPEGILNGPGEGKLLRNASGNRVSIVKAALPHLAVFEFTIEGPFDGPEPHTRADETDSFYIMEGELDRAGGIAHLRFLNIHAPGGFERELRAMSI